MKKINILAIAVLLIVVHAVVFIAVIGSKENDSSPANSAQNAQPSEVGTRESDDSQLPLLKLNDLLASPTTLPEPTPSPTVIREQPETTTSSSVIREQPARTETIAKPVNRPGYLRSDRPSRRTTQVYSNLVGDPYQGAIVVDARTGKILYENKATNYAYPASVTKLMTLLIVLEQVDAGKIHLNDRVKITKEIAGIGGSGVYLDVRETEAFTVNQMLEALTIHSANDAAAALAVHVAGSMDGFVDMMNQKARQLGMNSTTYHTPHGLPLTQQPDISTPYDIALLSLACLQHPETLEYTSTKLSWLPTNSLRKERFMLANRNVLVGKAPYPGCDGLKTGYHSRGGYSLSATAQQGDKRVLAVILGVPDSTTRTATMRNLLDKGFEAMAN